MLKASLRAKCPSSSWTSKLPLILLDLQSASRESDAVWSFEGTFIVPPILPGDLWGSSVTPNQEFLMSSSVPLGPARRPACCPIGQSAGCKFVLVRVDGSGRPPLAPLYSGPFLVLERYRSSFKLQIGTRQEVVNISRLKPAFTPSDASPAQPSKRGRPRKLTPVPVPQPAAKRVEVVHIHLPSPAEKFVLLHPPSPAE